MIKRLTGCWNGLPGSSRMQSHHGYLGFDDLPPQVVLLVKAQISSARYGNVPFLLSTKFVSGWLSHSTHSVDQLDVYRCIKRYNAVRSIIILPSARRWQQQNVNQIPKSQQTPHTSPSRAPHYKTIVNALGTGLSATIVFTQRNVYPMCCILTHEYIALTLEWFRAVNGKDVETRRFHW